MTLDDIRKMQLAVGAPIDVALVAGPSWYGAFLQVRTTTADVLEISPTGAAPILIALADVASIAPWDVSRLTWDELAALGIRQGQRIANATPRG